MEKRNASVKAETSVSLSELRRAKSRTRSATRGREPRGLLGPLRQRRCYLANFLASLLAAERFPIYDQHVHRAMAFLQTGEREEIPDYDPQKVESYWRRYLPFHATFEGIESRSVDKALWAFGKFLKEYRFPTGPLNGK